MENELKNCLNEDILLRVYSYLPKSTVYKSCVLVNQFWEKTASNKYINGKIIIISVYIVSNKKTSYSPWVFRSIQEAIDYCPKDSIIHISVRFKEIID